jgi:hypothetical protein
MRKYIIGFIAASILWVLLLSTIEIPEYKIYDCGMAEWHPDIPPAVRDECRNKRKNETETEKRLHENGRNLLRT